MIQETWEFVDIMTKDNGRAIKQEKERYPDQKRSKTLFAEDMILHTENPKKFSLKDYQS